MNQIYSYDEGKQWIHKMAKEASEDKKTCSKVIVDLALLMFHMKYVWEYSNTLLSKHLYVQTSKQH